MKIGVISDTHVPQTAKEIPQKILAAFRGMDMILHAGDLVSLEILDELKRYCPCVHAVWGNMDPEEVRKKLAQKEIIAAGKYRIGLMHGYGAPTGLVDLLTEIFQDEHVDIIVFGHSHQPCNEFINGILYFNPGSATDKIFSPYNSYGIIEINDRIEAKIVKL